VEPGSNVREHLGPASGRGDDRQGPNRHLGSRVDSQNPVPKAWFGDLRGQRVLCLASGGGQQAPILAAAGATVVSFDLSEEQLRKDQLVAERDRLDLRCVRGDMTDLSCLAAASFDLIFHPVSNVFVPDLASVWRECHRVVRPGGAVLAGFMNPAMFLFDHNEAESTGQLLANSGCLTPTRPA